MSRAMPRLIVVLVSLCLVTLACQNAAQPPNVIVITATSAASSPPTVTLAPAATSTPVPPEPTLPPTGVQPTAGPAASLIPPLAAGQPVTLTSVQMVDPLLGWGAASDLDNAMHILRTADGGQTWQDVTPPEPRALPGEMAMPQEGALLAVDADTAWAAYIQVGTKPIVVWRTADGGQTWTASQPLQLVSLGDFYQPSDIFFADAQRGWLLAHLGAGMSHDYVALFATVDGGQTWEQVVVPDQSTLPMACQKTGLAFTDAQTGWITGDCGGVVPGDVYLYQTTDGGRTWQQHPLPPPADAPDLFKQEAQVACGAYGPAFFSAQSGALTVRCMFYDTSKLRAWVYITADGGQTWTPRELPVGLGTADFLTANAGWLLGAATYDATTYSIYQTLDGGQTWTKAKEISWHLSWNGRLDFVDEQTGWAVAVSPEGQNALVQTSDGGKTWRLLTPQLAP